MNELDINLANSTTPSSLFNKVRKRRNTAAPKIPVRNAAHGAKESQPAQTAA